MSEQRAATVQPPVQPACNPVQLACRPPPYTPGGLTRPARLYVVRAVSLRQIGRILSLCVRPGAVLSHPPVPPVFVGHEGNRTGFGDPQPVRLLLKSPETSHKLSIDAQSPFVACRLDRFGEPSGRNRRRMEPAPLSANIAGGSQIPTPMPHRDRSQKEGRRGCRTPGNRILRRARTCSQSFADLCSKLFARTFPRKSWNGAISTNLRQNFSRFVNYGRASHGVGHLVRSNDRQRMATFFAANNRGCIHGKFAGPSGPNLSAA